MRTPYHCTAVILSILLSSNNKHGKPYFDFRNCVMLVHHISQVHLWIYRKRGNGVSTTLCYSLKHGCLYLNDFSHQEKNRHNCQYAWFCFGIKCFRSWMPLYLLCYVDSDLIGHIVQLAMTRNSCSTCSQNVDFRCSLRENIDTEK